MNPRLPRRCLLAMGVLLSILEAGPLYSHPLAGDGASAALSIPVPGDARLDRWLSQMGAAHRSSTRSALERSGRYRAMIQGEINKRGLPEELLYLAMIESEYKTGARSSASAVGMWQFMAPTARVMGLEVSRYVDERRDPVRSTQAALDHLEDLHRQFGSWSLAAAAYNAGSPRVARALERTMGSIGSTNEATFWRISALLPRETQQYLPRWLAAIRIAKNPAAFGIESLAYDKPVQFSTRQVNGGVALASLAREMGIEAEVLYDLNPHLVRRMTPPGRPWLVRVPLQASATSVAASAGEIPWAIGGAEISDAPVSDALRDMLLEYRSARICGAGLQGERRGRVMWARARLSSPSLLLLDDGQTATGERDLSIPVRSFALHGESGRRRRRGPRPVVRRPATS